MSTVEHLFVDTFGAFIGKHSERLFVSKGKETLTQAPLMHLKHVTIASCGVSISADAIKEWNTGNLDALVASKEKAAVLMRDLQGAVLSQLQSNEQEQHDQGRGYVLITR